MKSGYAGKKWDAETFANKMSDAKSQLKRLRVLPNVNHIRQSVFVSSGTVGDSEFAG